MIPLPSNLILGKEEKGKQLAEQDLDSMVPNDCLDTASWMKLERQ